jgi:prevent-host-death family protein
MKLLMIASQHTQSLTDFRQKATETLNRLNKTGQAEILTVNGKARAVLLSPKGYDELARDA